MAASLATIDDLCGSITGRNVQAEVRTATARAGELLVTQRPTWLDDAAQRLEALVDLPENWNSYGARQVSISTALDAMDLLARLYDLGLPSPGIIPTATGGVQLEWDVSGLELELVLGPGGEMFAMFDDPAREETWELELPPRDLGRIGGALRRIASTGHSG